MPLKPPSARQLYYLKALAERPAKRLRAANLDRGQPRDQTAEEHQPEHAP